MMKMTKVLGIGVGLMAAVASAHADDIQVATSDYQAILGSAYDSRLQSFNGNPCITGTATTAEGPGKGVFTFDETISDVQLSSELGFGAGFKASYGLTSASAEAKFARQSTSDQFSVSSVWESTYDFPSVYLSNPVLSTYGQSVINTGHWNEVCGDQYVSEIARGAKLFFSIRIDFSSVAEKESFEAKFDISGSAVSANAAVNTASSSLNRKTQITVSAYQIGGDASKLTQLFGDAKTVGDGGTHVAQCSAGDIKNCTDVIRSFLTYAADVTNGFPSQLSKSAVGGGPAPLTYKTIAYSKAAIFQKGDDPILMAGVASARAELSKVFTRQFADQVAAERLMDENEYQATPKNLVQREKEKIDFNLDEIEAVEQNCYELADLSCVKTVNCIVDGVDCANTSLGGNVLSKLEPINESYLQPPSFQVLCTFAQSLDALDPMKITFASIQQSLGAQAPALPQTPGGAQPDCTLEPVATASQGYCAQVRNYCARFESVVEGISEVSLSSNGGPRFITDLRPLTTLINLTSLSVVDSSLDDIGPLASLVNLKSLDLHGNRISDASPLEGMTQLQTLDLSGNNLTGIDALSPLVHLERLSVAGNDIAKLPGTPLFPALVEINVSNNPVVYLDANAEGSVAIFKKKIPSNVLVIESKKSSLLNFFKEMEK